MNVVVHVNIFLPFCLRRLELLLSGTLWSRAGKGQCVKNIIKATVKAQLIVALPCTAPVCLAFNWSMPTLLRPYAFPAVSISFQQANHFMRRTLGMLGMCAHEGCKGFVLMLPAPFKNAQPAGAFMNA